MHFYIIFLQPQFHRPIVKFATFIHPYFVYFASGLILNFLTSSISIVIPYYILSFKGVAHVYLLKISIIYNKNWNPLSCLLTNCILARSAPQIFSLKDEYTFRFPNFLMISLCSFLARAWFDITAL